MFKQPIEFALTSLHRSFSRRRSRPEAPPPARSGCIGYEIDESGNLLRAAPFVMDHGSMLKHFGIIGPPGSGKSVACRTIALAKAADDGVNTMLFDPRGDDIVDRMLAHYVAIAPPDKWIGRIGLLDATAERVSNHNALYVAPGSDPERTVMAFCARVVAVTGASGLRWPEHLRNIVMALCYSGLDVCPMDILAFMANQAYRRKVLTAVGNRAPFVTSYFRNTYEPLSAAEKMAWDAPVATHVSPLVGTKFLRRLYRPGPSWDVSAFIDAAPGKTFLAAFRLGTVPKQSALLASSTLLGDILGAAFARDTIPESDRRPTFLLIDEASHFAGDDSVRQAEIETRKYALGLGVMLQSVVQIPSTDLRREMIGNLHYILAGRLGAADATDIVREAGADHPDRVRKRLMRLKPGEMLVIQKGSAPKFVKINKDPYVKVDQGAVEALRQIALDTMNARPVAEIDREIEERYAGLLSNEPGDGQPAHGNTSTPEVREGRGNRSFRRKQGGDHD